jgi:hypothetical protein
VSAGAQRSPHHHGRSVLLIRLFLGLASLATVGALGPGRSLAQEPAGLAARALADTSFTWIRRDTVGFRVHFAAGSHAARHQDSLLARLPAALENARRLLGTRAPDGMLDVFFVESRDDMAKLVGGRATGFAHRAARAVFLVNNPTWRAFERHEVMHVVAWHAWGPPAANTDWLEEGLAQAADGRCDDFSNETALRGLVRRRGWVPFDALLGDFRQQPDLRAYLQAAVFTDHLLRTYGPTALAALWRQEEHANAMLRGRSLRAIEAEWRTRVVIGPIPDEAALYRIEGDGCGATSARRDAPRPRAG